MDPWDPWLIDSEVGSDGWHCDDKRWQCYFARGGSEVNIHHNVCWKTDGFCCFVKVMDALILFWRRETKTLEITKMPGLVKVKRAG